MADGETRFGALGRLYGAEALARFARARVCVVGLGGVGSWLVEALARSGVGGLTLVDLDEICLSNVNRQVHAADATVGRTKAEVLAERIRGFAPECEVRTELAFFTENTAARILEGGYDWVADAIDGTRHKCALIAAARERGLPLITCGGAGGRTDPTRVGIADLAGTTSDPLLAQVRRRLRREHGFPADPAAPFGVDCVFSREPPVYPTACGGVSRKAAPDADHRLNCDTGFGTAAHVTGTFGFVMAGAVLRGLADG